MTGNGTCPASVLAMVPSFNDSHVFEAHHDNSKYFYFFSDGWLFDCKKSERRDARFKTFLIKWKRSVKQFLLAK